MNVLLLRAWLARFGPDLIGSRLRRAVQQDDRSLLLDLETDAGRGTLLLSVLEECPVLALVTDLAALPAPAEAEGNFVKALNFHLQDYRLVAIQQQGLDRSVLLTFKHRDKYGKETLKVLRPELATRSGNAYLLSDRGMVISIMKRVRRDRERVRAISTGKPLPPPPPLGKYVAEDGGLEVLSVELAQYAASGEPDPEGSLRGFFTSRVAGADPRLWPALEPLIPVDYDLDSLHDFIARLQSGDLNTQLFGLGPGHDENSAALEEWLAARHKRGMPRQAADPQRQRAASKLDQLIAEQRIAQHSDELELLALSMLGEAPALDAAGRALDWLEEFRSTHERWAAHVDPTRSVHSNATDLLKLAQRLRRALPKLEERIAEAQQELAELEAGRPRVSAAAKPRSARAESELHNLDKLGVKYRRFVSSDGMQILCGLNDRSNDGLVRLFGSSRHLWLHARNHAGSHVIVLDGANDTPAATLEEAAIIAAYHSQGRDEADVEVSYLPMNQVRRPRNGKPGQVLKMDEKVIAVRPQRFEQLRTALSRGAAASS